MILRNFYISGPITNNPHFKKDFEKVENRLNEIFSAIEHTVINPVKFNADIKKKYQEKLGKDFNIANEEFHSACLKRCFKEINKCSFLILTDSYQKYPSKGTEAELDYARKKGIIIVKNVEELAVFKKIL